MPVVLQVRDLSKWFTLHAQGGVSLAVFDGVDFSLRQGECVCLTGRSGSGKSTFLRMISANYICPRGSIGVLHDGNWVDMASSTPRTIIDVRRRTIGHVSQFLRAIPRVPTISIVSAPLRAIGFEQNAARERAEALLRRLGIPDRLWSLSPLTFSGGEQQRVNIAKCFVADYPIMLLDEPTASLDDENQDIVLDLIQEAKGRGAAILGAFHSKAIQDAVCTGTFDIAGFPTRAQG